MASTDTIPKIPAGSEYVACPSCKTLGWRKAGTDLLCPDCEVSAIPIDAPHCTAELPCDYPHRCRGKLHNRA